MLFTQINVLFDPCIFSLLIESCCKLRVKEAKHFSVVVYVTFYVR